jgi:hypothetical protein
LLNLNNTTDLFLQVRYQLSSINKETGMFCSAVKEKRSCNKNSIKNTEMLEKYIIAFPSKK